MLRSEELLCEHDYLGINRQPYGGFQAGDNSTGERSVCSPFTAIS